MILTKEMVINHFVIHYIQKDQFRDPDVQAKAEEPKLLTDGGNPTPQGVLIQTFVESAAEMFTRQRSGQVFADIGKDGNTFAEILDRYLSKEISFIRFSKRLADELANSMKGAPLATGGYMAIAEYTASPRHLLILMIKQEEGYAVDPNTLELRQSVQLDLTTINVGAKINLEDYAAGNVRHLSLVRGLKELSKYFRNFIGVENFKSAREETSELASVMDHYFRENHENYDTARVQEIKRNVAQLIKESKGEITPLITIAGLVNPLDPEGFHEYANANGVSAEITGDADVIKGWLRVRYKNPKLLLDFEKSLLHQSIHWSKEEDRLIFDVSSFPHLEAKLEEAEQ